MKTTILNIMFLAGLSTMTGFSSCVSDEVKKLADKVPQQDNKGYFISLDGECGTEITDLSRAHWDEDEQNVPHFYWDSSYDEMKAFVFRNTAALNYVTDNTYANVKITPKEDRLKCSMQITDGLSEVFQEGDVVWAVSPIRDIAGIENSSVKFTLPDSYDYTDGHQTKTYHLKNYVLMSGVGTVRNERASINFQIHPTIFRFKITNSDKENLIVNSITFSGPFNNQAVLAYDEGESVTFSKTSEQYSIKVNISEGLTILPTESKYLYALVMPTELSDENVMFSITSNFGDKSQILVYSDVFQGKEGSADTGFKSNTYKTLNVAMKRTSVKLSGTTINGFGQGGDCDVSL